MGLNIDDAVAELFRKHIKMLDDKGTKPNNLVDEEPLSLEHAHWMAIEALRGHTKEGWSLDKVSRWQGYIQAVLVMHKISSVDQERDITRKLMQ